MSRVDAQGSLRALELFKMLDRDRDDLISPTDLYRARAATCTHREWTASDCWLGRGALVSLGVYRM